MKELQFEKGIGISEIHAFLSNDCPMDNNVFQSFTVAEFEHFNNLNTISNLNVIIWLLHQKSGVTFLTSSIVEFLNLTIFLFNAFLFIFLKSSNLTLDSTTSLPSIQQAESPKIDFQTEKIVIASS
jgi:hypothetical protein